MDCEWQEKCNGVPGCLIRHEAADALESLRAENEHIRSNCYARDGVQAIIDERDRFKAERDAAVKPNGQDAMMEAVKARLKKYTA